MYLIVFLIETKIKFTMKDCPICHNSEHVETLKALTKRGHFSCPLRDGLCPHGCETCSSFTSFHDIAPHCNRNIYRGPIAKLILENNNGNSIDCMLFDYLLDYGFNPMIFE